MMGRWLQFFIHQNPYPHLYDQQCDLHALVLQFAMNKRVRQSGRGGFPGYRSIMQNYAVVGSFDAKCQEVQHTRIPLQIWCLSNTLYKWSKL